MTDAIQFDRKAKGTATVPMRMAGYLLVKEGKTHLEDNPTSYLDAASYGYV